jgi:hypothetical protein
LQRATCDTAINVGEFARIIIDGQLPFLFAEPSHDESSETAINATIAGFFQHLNLSLNFSYLLPRKHESSVRCRTKESISTIGHRPAGMVLGRKDNEGITSRVMYDGLRQGRRFRR